MLPAASPPQGRSDIDRNGLLWKENATAGSWATRAHGRELTCSCVKDLLAAHGPLVLCSTRSVTPSARGALVAQLTCGFRTAATEKGTDLGTREVEATAQTDKGESL